MTSKRDSRCFVLVGARCVCDCVDKVAVFSVHKRSIIELNEHRPKLSVANILYTVYTVKFDTYRNLQRHRAVLPAIARLSFRQYYACRLLFLLLRCFCVGLQHCISQYCKPTVWLVQVVASK